MTWKKTPASRRSDGQAYGADYRRNRSIVMARAKWRCEIRTEGVCTMAATTCDHIVPVSQGGTNAVSNLRAACEPCHRRKTAVEGSGYRRRGSSADPEPRGRTAW